MTLSIYFLSLVIEKVVLTEEKFPTWCVLGTEIIVTCSFAETEVAVTTDASNKVGAYSFSNDFKFEANEIEILDQGNIVKSLGGVKIISNDNLEITADKSFYDKKKSILKRKLYENMDFPQKRVQKFSPASGKPSMNKTLVMLKEFVDDAFTEDGEYNTSHQFKKLPSAKNCKWCEFKDKPELCDRRK